MRLLGLIAYLGSVLAMASAEASLPADPYNANIIDQVPVYNYNYGVRESKSGVDFAQEEERDGDFTRGSYRVSLPDGRIQVVTYTVEDGKSGLVAEVTYESPDGGKPLPYVDVQENVIPEDDGDVLVPVEEEAELEVPVIEVVESDVAAAKADYASAELRYSDQEDVVATATTAQPLAIDYNEEAVDVVEDSVASTPGYGITTEPAVEDEAVTVVSTAAGVDAGLAAAEDITTEAPVEDNDELTATTAGYKRVTHDPILTSTEDVNLPLVREEKNIGFGPHHAAAPRSHIKARQFKVVRKPVKAFHHHPSNQIEGNYKHQEAHYPAASNVYRSKIRYLTQPKMIKAVVQEQPEYHTARPVIAPQERNEIEPQQPQAYGQYVRPNHYKHYARQHQYQHQQLEAAQPVHHHQTPFVYRSKIRTIPKAAALSRAPKKLNTFDSKRGQTFFSQQSEQPQVRRLETAALTNQDLDNRVADHEVDSGAATSPTAAAAARPAVEFQRMIDAGIVKIPNLPPISPVRYLPHPKVIGGSGIKPAALLFSSTTTTTESADPATTRSPARVGHVISNSLYRESTKTGNIAVASKAGSSATPAPAFKTFTNGIPLFSNGHETTTTFPSIDAPATTDNSYTIFF